ncbi:hypothetical protein HOY82DRAFT_291660 [Tuber indicum]|nr:hypothetical protein HOY82DRAFT_291660 [Tuber indicum]
MCRANRGGFFFLFFFFSQIRSDVSSASTSISLFCLRLIDRLIDWQLGRATVLGKKGKGKSNDEVCQQWLSFFLSFFSFFVSFPGEVTGGGGGGESGRRRWEEGRVFHCSPFFRLSARGRWADWMTTSGWLLVLVL